MNHCHKLHRWVIIVNSRYIVYCRGLSCFYSVIWLFRWSGWRNRHVAAGGSRLSWDLCYQLHRKWLSIYEDWENQTVLSGHKYTFWKLKHSHWKARFHFFFNFNRFVTASENVTTGREKMSIFRRFLLAVTSFFLLFPNFSKSFRTRHRKTRSCWFSCKSVRR